MQRAAMFALTGLMLITGCAPRLQPVAPAADLQPVAMRDHDRGLPEARFDVGSPRVTFVHEPGIGLYVRPMVNGRDVGRFILDTGATGMTITADAAQNAGLKPVGTTTLIGDRRTAVYECSDFALGPLHLHRVRLAGLNVTGPAIFGPDFAGFCGYDVFNAAVVELDLDEGALRLHDPAEFTMPGSETVALRLHENLPWIAGSIESKLDGLLLIDTGQDEALQILSSVVDRHRLLEGRETRRAGMTTLFSTQPARRATLASVTLADDTVSDVPALLLRGADAPIPMPDDAPVVGIVGLELLRHFHVIFNYSDRSIALRRFRQRAPESETEPEEDVLLDGGFTSDDDETLERDFSVPPP